MKHEPAIAAALDMPVKQYTLDDGHVMRSRVLDAFSRLEKIIAEKARIAGSKVTRGAPISEYMRDLAEADFKSPTKAKQKLEHAKALMLCRNDIVHSELEVTECSGGMSGTFYIFQNIALAQEMAGRCVRMIRADEFDGLAGVVKKLANELNQQQLKAEAPAAPASASVPAAPPTPQ